LLAVYVDPVTKLKAARETAFEVDADTMGGFPLDQCDGLKLKGELGMIRVAHRDAIVRAAVRIGENITFQINALADLQQFYWAAHDAAACQFLNVCH
jgi:hypothetical protein